MISLFCKNLIIILFVLIGLTLYHNIKYNIMIDLKKVVGEEISIIKRGNKKSMNESSYKDKNNLNITDNSDYINSTDNNNSYNETYYSENWCENILTQNNQDNISYIDLIECISEKNINKSGMKNDRDIDRKKGILIEKIIDAIESDNIQFQSDFYDM